MELHIITPVTRIGNVFEIHQNLVNSFKKLDVKWYCIFDSFVSFFANPFVEKVGSVSVALWRQSKIQCPWGYACRNQVLDILENGWIYFLDDDNLIHPAFEETFINCLEKFPDSRWFIFRQIRPDGRIYLYETDRPRVNYVDMGQCVVERSVIGNIRMDNRRDADGKFYEQLLKNVSPIAIPIAATYYNALRRDQ